MSCIVLVMSDSMEPCIFAQNLRKWDWSLWGNQNCLSGGGDTQVFELFCCLKDGCTSAQCDMCSGCLHQAEVMNDSKRAWFCERKAKTAHQGGSWGTGNLSWLMTGKFKTDDLALRCVSVSFHLLAADSAAEVEPLVCYFWFAVVFRKRGKFI